MNIDWNAKGYQKDFAFVPKYGEAVLDLIDAAPGALAVDLGCGNGGLTGKLIERGYRVVGVDASAPMLALAKERYLDTTFLQADACTFQLPEQADVIFSNAVLHWIDAAKQNELIANIASQLKPGGQLVCEFGGKGCAETVHAAMEKIFAAHGLTYRRTFYFPTVGEYAPMLERHGLQVRAALLFDRPTPQQTEDGLADWIRMFDKAPFAGVSEELQETIIREAVETLRPVLYHDGQLVCGLRAHPHQGSQGGKNKWHFSIPWLETVSKRERQRREEKAQKLMFPFGDEQRTAELAVLRALIQTKTRDADLLYQLFQAKGLSAAYAGRNARRTAGEAGRMADKPAGPQL